MLHLYRLMITAAPALSKKAPGLHLLLPPQTLNSVSGLAAPRLAPASRTLAQPPRHPARLASSSSSSAAAMTTAAALAVPEPAAVQPVPDAAAAAAAAVAGAAATQSTLLQQQQQRVHTTKLLAINADTLPAAAAPDRDMATAYLTAPDAPDLGPDSCPHLYYHQHSSSSSSDALQEAAQLLRLGQPIAIPTETVYGLAADGLSAAAVAAVYAAKGRPSDNPLILHISDLDMLARLYPQQQEQQQQQQQQDCSSSNGNGCTHNSSSSRLAFLPKQYHRLIAAFWPGPLTLLLPASPLIPAAVTAGLPTVAVRMPAHPVARALIAAAGVPLAAPSANTSGRPSPTTAQHVMQDLAGRVAAVVDGGPCTCGVESTVLDGLRDPPVVLRPGGITPELLALCADMQGLQVYQRDFTDKQLEDTPTTPGMKYRHYSPTAPLLLLDPTAAWQAQQQQQEQQQHDGLQQLVVNATQQLLEDLWQAQQQQQQQQQLAQHAAVQRVVLLSTCSSAKVGWTEASLQLLQQHLQEHAQPPGLPSDPQPAATGRATAVNSSRPDVLEYVLGSWQQPEVVAQQVFAALRAADAVGPALIIAQGLPPEGPALAIMNRLQKAASQHVQVAATVVPKS